MRPEIAIADTFTETLEEIARERKSRETEVRAAVQAAAERFGVPATSLQVRDGDPFEELTAVAEEVDADAIVVGASTKRLGSLATRLIRDGRWAVTVVP